MSNKIRPPVWFPTVIAAAFFGGFLALWLTDFAIVSADWCVASDEHCVREWIGAFSGWAAAVAAGATIFVLWRQLKSLQEQTDFVIGRATPTVTVQLRDRWVLEARFLNWNRHPLRIEQVEARTVQGIEVLIAYSAVNDPNSRANVAHDGTAFEVRGWENRNEPPPYFRADYTAHRLHDDGSPVDLILTFRCVIVGSLHQRITLTAHADQIELRQ